MYDNATVVALVEAARAGDNEAWNAIVERYASLVWNICRRYRLNRPDTDDVAQFVWLRLFENLAAIREPAALPGWIASTTRNECLRVLRAAGRPDGTDRLDDHLLLDGVGVDGGYDTVEEEMERSRQYVALRQACAQLRPQCRRLLELLFAEDRRPYAQISTELGMKVGSIGPTRERCLAHLRRCPAMVELIESYQQQESGGEARVRRLVDQ